MDGTTIGGGLVAAHRRGSDGHGSSGAVWVRWTALLLFGTGFGYVEAAVVHYLRRVIGYHAGYEVAAQHVYLDLRVIAFVRPEHTVLVDTVLTQVEVAREAATLLMLLAVAVLAADTLRRRVAAFFIAFAVWDLTYYVFLRVLDGWPARLTDLDVFFLIPVTWVGPVLTAVVASTVVLVVASWAYVARGPGEKSSEPPSGT